MSEKEQVPRELKEIQQEYQELCLKAGQAQYQVKVLKAELDNYNSRLLEINREAAARNELDKKAKEEASNG